MRSASKLFIPALVASLMLAACGSSSKGSGSSAQAGSTPAGTTSSSSAESAVVVKSASNATLGTTVLVDAQGMTLYHLSGEQNGKFICTSSACVHVWHPVSASGTPSGTVGSLGTVKRPDGTVQVTYKGMPLYTFASDQKPGEAKGQGIKDVGTWTAVTVSASGSSGAASSPATTPTQTTPPASSGGGGGYGY